MAERKNQTIQEAAKAMLEENNMPKSYWVDTVITTIYLQNRTSAAVGNVSSHKLYFEKKTNLEITIGNSSVQFKNIQTESV